MHEIIAKLQAFVAQPEVDQMTPIWSISQDDARQILALIDELQVALKDTYKLTNEMLTFKQIKDAARRNGADAL